MPDKIVKQVETVITARDDSAAGVASFEDRVKRMADDVPSYVSGRSAGDEKQLSRMRDYYQKLEDIEAKAEIPKLQGIFDHAPDISRAESAGESIGRASGEAASRTFAQEFGRGNPLAQTFRILAGGGALLAVDMLARGIGEAADRADQLEKSFKKGEISGAEFAGDLLRTIPVLGEFTKAFDSLGHLARDLAGLPNADDKLGERLDAVEQARKDEDARQKQAQKIYEDRKKIVDEINKTSEGLSSEAGTAGLTGWQKDRADSLDKYNKSVRDVQDQETKLGGLSPDQQDAARKRFQQDKIDALKIYEAESKRIVAEADKEYDEQQKKQQDFADHMMELQKRLANQMRESMAEQQRKKDEDAQKQLDIAQQLQDMRIDELKAGGGISQNEAKRLAVAEQYLAKQKELQKIINDASATPAQKADAQSLLGGLAGAESAAERDAVRVSRRGTASAESAGNLHGLIEQATTKAADPMVELNATSRETNKETKMAREILQQVRDMLALTHGSSPALIKAV